MSAKTSAAVKNKWNRENYDRAEVVFPKGKKDQIKTHAEACGESVNAFINRAINETMEHDNTRNEKEVTK